MSSRIVPLSVLETFNQNQGRMAISSIIFAELAHGVKKSANPARNLSMVEDFVSRLDVLPYDDRTAWQYGIIRAALERQGTPIGVNDLHIPGHARSLGMIIVTNNLREFERVSGISEVNWVQEEHRLAWPCPITIHYSRSFPTYLGRNYFSSTLNLFIPKFRDGLGYLLVRSSLLSFRKPST